MRNKKIQVLCLAGSLIALHIVLELFATIRIGNELKISFATLPFVAAALLLGTAFGALVAFAGTFLSQMLTYGFSATTLVWILPGVIMALTAGVIFKAFRGRRSVLSISAAVFAGMLSLAIFNLLASYVDGVLVYKYMNLYGLFALIPLRLLNAALTGVAYVPVCMGVCKLGFRS